MNGGIAGRISGANTLSRSGNVTALPFRARNWVAAALVLTDLAVLEACFGLAVLLRHAFVPWLPIELGPTNYLGVAAGLAVLPGAFWLLGLYPGYGVAGPERLRRRVLALGAVFAALIGWDYLVQDGIWSRGILLITCMLALFALPAINGLMTGALIRLRVWGTPVLVVGPSIEARAMISDLKAHSSIGLIPVGYLGLDAESQKRDVDGVPLVGCAKDVNRFAGGHIRTVLVVRPGRVQDSLHNLVMNLAFPHVILVPSELSGQALSVTSCDLGWTSGLEIKRNLLILRNRVFKRATDIALGVLLLVFALPLLAVLCVALMAVSRGSPIFSQVREGHEGRSFRMLKLRTMYSDAEQRLAAHLELSPKATDEWYRHFKLTDDPRILPIFGKMLRRSSLDELPQLINVLKGDMSLVGPRPLPHYHLENLPKASRRMRQKVRPGLTGLWQIEVRSDGDIDLLEFYDSYYIRNWSLWLDINILFRTVTAVLIGKGAR